MVLALKKRTAKYRRLDPSRYELSQKKSSGDGCPLSNPGQLRKAKERKLGKMVLNCLSPVPSVGQMKTPDFDARRVNSSSKSPRMCFCCIIKRENIKEPHR